MARSEQIYLHCQLRNQITFLMKKRFQKNDPNEDYEGDRKLIEQAKTITETNNGEIDDFLEDDNISKNLLEMLYDLNIKNW